MRLTRYRFGEFELDPASRELWRSGERLTLPLKSLECLAYLVAHRERAVGRDELISAVWGRTDVSDTVVAQTMRRARKALDDAGDRQTIVRTVSGFGYRWVAPVQVIETRADEPASAAEAAASPAATDAPVIAAAPSPIPTRQESTDSHRRWAWPLAAAGLLAIAAGAAALWWRSPSSPPGSSQATATNNLAMVLPVDVEPADPELSWVRLGAMEYVAGRLRAGDLKVAPSEQTLHLSAAMKREADTSTGPRYSDAALKDTLARSGAQWLLVPHAQRDRDRWRVQLRAIDRRSDVRVEAQGDTPLQAMAVASDAWLRRIGRSPPAVAGPSPLVERLQRVDAELDAGQLDAAREQIEQSPAAQRGDPRMVVREGQLEYRAGRVEQAQQLFERALATGAQADASTRAKGLMGLGSVALRQDRLEEAEDRYAQALAALQAPGHAVDDPVQLGNAYNGRGVARVRRHDLEGAVRDLGLARVAMQQNGDTVSAAMVGTNMGLIEAIRGHWPQAVQEYDSAITVFEHYQVRDYLAATLGAKARAQLAMVQPAQALQTIERTDTLSKSIEDTTLLGALSITRTRALIANGRLDAADATLRDLPDNALEDGDGTLVGLRMGAAIARGDHARAAALAMRVRPPTSPTDGPVVLVAVQAAGDAKVARAWSELIADKPSPNQALTTALGTAITERRFGDRAAALAAATQAATLANRDGSPDDRVRSLFLRAALLSENGQAQAAIAVLGELDAYMAVDYRAAWLAWSLYKHGGNTSMAERARARADALRGQRVLDHEPLL